MYEKITDCPHCKQETKVSFDVVNEGRLEGYEQQCPNCENYFLVQVKLYVEMS